MLRRPVRHSELLTFFKALPPCVIGTEACASAHFLGSRAERSGPHRAVDAGNVRETLCQAGKSDAIDPEAICEAVTADYALRANQERRTAIGRHAASNTRPPGAATDYAGQRSSWSPWRIRVDRCEGHLRLPGLLALASSAPVCQLPDLARECIELLLAQIEDLQRRIVMVDRIDRKLASSQ